MSVCDTAFYAIIMISSALITVPGLLTRNYDIRFWPCGESIWCYYHSLFRMSSVRGVLPRTVLFVVYIHIIKSICHSYQEYAKKSVCMFTVAMETGKNAIFHNFRHFPAVSEVSD